MRWGFDPRGARRWGGCSAAGRASRVDCAGGGSDRGPSWKAVEDFVGRFPGWARHLMALDGRVQGLERAVEALNDRMTHDPHLSQSLHEVLSSLSSVRATAAILAETEDLPPDWAERFHRNLHQDSERLAVGAEALVGYLDAGRGIEEQGIAAPQEEVEDWLRSRAWTTTDAELQAGLGDEIAALASSAARSLARTFARRAAEDAILLPEAVFGPALEEVGPDPIGLAERFGRLAPCGHAQDRGGAWIESRAGDLRCLGDADVPQACHWVCPAALRCGLSALAALCCTGAADAAVRSAGRDGGSKRSSVSCGCLVRVPSPAGLARTGIARGGDADPGR